MLKKLLLYSFLIVNGVASTAIEEFQKNIAQSPDGIVGAILYCAFNRKNDINLCAEGLRKTIFSEAFLINSKLSLNPGQLTEMVVSAVLLAFAQKDRDYWQDYQGLSANNQAIASLAEAKLFKFCAIIKYFQNNLNNQIYPLNETFEAVATNANLKDQIFFRAPAPTLQSINQYVAELKELYKEFNFAKKYMILEGFWMQGDQNKMECMLSTLNKQDFLANFSNDFKQYFSKESAFTQFLAKNQEIAQFISINNLQIAINPMLIQKPVVKKPELPPKQPIPKDFVAINPKYTDMLNNLEFAGRTPDELTKEFSIAFKHYTVTPPPALSEQALILYQQNMLAIEKFIEIYPEIKQQPEQRIKSIKEYKGTPRTFKELFETMIKALDIYFFCTRFHDAITHAIETKIDHATGANPHLYDKVLTDKQFTPYPSSGNSNYVGHAELDAIGFLRNHAGNKDMHMFRPEYEIPWLTLEDMAYFSSIFEIGVPIRPNYHVELALESIKGRNPKPKDLAQTLSENYATLGENFIECFKYLQGLGVKTNALDKWKTFFELAFNGACADEYLLALVEWKITHGPLSEGTEDNLPVTDITVWSVDLNNFIETKKIKTMLKTNFQLNKITMLNILAITNWRENLEAILGKSLTADLKQELRKKNQTPSDEMIFKEIFSLVVGYE